MLSKQNEVSIKLRGEFKNMHEGVDVLEEDGKYLNVEYVNWLESKVDELRKN